MTDAAIRSYGRYLPSGVGALIAASIAYLFSQSDFYSFGFLMGAMAGLMVQTLLIVAFYIAVASRK